MSTPAPNAPESFQKWRPRNCIEYPKSTYDCGHDENKIRWGFCWNDMTGQGTCNKQKVRKPYRIYGNCSNCERNIAADIDSIFATFKGKLDPVLFLSLRPHINAIKGGLGAAAPSESFPKDREKPASIPAYIRKEIAWRFLEAKGHKTVLGLFHELKVVTLLDAQSRKPEERLYYMVGDDGRVEGSSYYQYKGIPPPEEVSGDAMDVSE
ncbi:uncharacterized protein BCR38DRAFT_491627 [Pseudomassariella vexata]|uniref:Uncharacterized protein n=1 Tax=Pseudomassariella vexata TaxID=1141098 RepID=A0A1Y2EJF4_9PEZI|nr:uncharacterized protein BCR38DRAFT_491627 [Pseudomassariella vexata]ORY70945.1 hypothetical protein BCR38DRAFT_491627 [Pseudomassariella vexata]